VIAPRHTASLGFPPIGGVWTGTHIALPHTARRWREVFTGRVLETSTIPLADFPVAVFVAEN